MKTSMSKKALILMQLQIIGTGPISISSAVKHHSETYNHTVLKQSKVHNGDPTPEHKKTTNRTTTGSTTAGLKYGPRQAKMVFEHVQNVRFTSFCKCALTTPGLCSALIHSLISNNSVSGQ